MTFMSTTFQAVTHFKRPSPKYKTSFRIYVIVITGIAPPKMALITRVNAIFVLKTTIKADGLIYPVISHSDPL